MLQLPSMLSLLNKILISGLRPPTRGDYLVYTGLSLTRKPFADVMFAFKVRLGFVLVNEPCSNWFHPQSNLIINNAGIVRSGEELKLLVLSSPRVQKYVVF